MLDFRVFHPLPWAAQKEAGHLEDWVYFGADLVCVPALLVAMAIGQEDVDDAMLLVGPDRKTGQACLALLGYYPANVAEVLDQEQIVIS